MEGGDSILDAIYEEENFDNVDEDVDMIDVEEGELVERNSQNVMGQSSTEIANQESLSKNRKRRANKKKRKRKSSGSNDIDRFVLDACRRLKERKSYMVYTAVGCLGVSALRDLIREVDAIQACGGQKTADGKRLRTGGGILWNIIKVREPNAYREIMKKVKEFEKQFRQPNVKPSSNEKKEDPSQGLAFSSANASKGNVSDSAPIASQMQNQHEPSASEGKRPSVHDRLRIPVPYDDELLGEDAKNDTS
ncbi:hypothetical protein L6164_024526 [Bauhinia variegata]|uniref:Uncharacterized protein n=1 Tax=Bauhinia variegata TaxID=167791 RepID=A0ACB9LXR6_BAUVA|nr:hypothetical protein L6164_024526 [Bauhinia variegata]